MTAFLRVGKTGSPARKRTHALVLPDPRPARDHEPRAHGPDLLGQLHRGAPEQEPHLAARPGSVRLPAFAPSWWTLRGRTARYAAGMQHVSLRAAVAAALILAAGCSGGAGSNLAPATTAQRPAAAAARNPGSLIIIPPGGFDLYWSAQSIWVGDNHLCSDPTTCSALERVPATANGATSNTALEIYPSAYPY